MPNDYIEVAEINGTEYDLHDVGARAALETKAEVDGSYANLTSGYAEQMTSSIVETDETPYLFRTAGGNAEIGNYEEDTIVGGSVAWNQMVQNTDVWSNLNATHTFSDGTITISNSGSALFGTFLQSGHRFSITGHKYFLTARAQVDDTTWFFFGLETGRKTFSIAANTEQVFALIQSAQVDNNAITLYFNSGTTALVKNVQCTDLTALFGSTIADYIYSLETANTGSGVSWLKSHGWFTNDYYPYCESKMKSVSAVQSHDMVGFNAYDPDTGKVKVVGGMQYQIVGAYTALSLDGETITPDSNGKFTPTADGELTVTGGNATTTTVHLVWDGERDGEYEAYRKESYALDSSLTLRGVLELDASNNLRYNGDKYYPDGTVERRFGIKVLGGTENFTLSAQSGYNPRRFLLNISSWGAVGIAWRTTAVSSHLIYNLTASISEAFGTFRVSTTYLTIPDADSKFADATAFKTWLESNPITIIYELATPTTETAAPFQSPQWVDNWGTEEYVVTEDSDGVAVPVGHVTEYPVDLKAKLEATADNPQTDGIYLLQYANGTATYTPLASDSTITDILDRLTALENAQEGE